MRERTGLRPSRYELWAGRSLRSARLIRRSLAVGVGRLRSRRLLYFAAVRQPTPHHRSCRRRLRRNPPAQATATKKVPPIVIGRLEAKGLRGGCSRKARSNAVPIRAAVSPIAHKSSTCNHVLRVLSQEVIGSSCTRRTADHSPPGGRRPSAEGRRPHWTQSLRSGLILIRSIMASSGPCTSPGKRLDAGRWSTPESDRVHGCWCQPLVSDISGSIDGRPGQGVRAPLNLRRQHDEPWRTLQSGCEAPHRARRAPGQWTKQPSQLRKRSREVWLRRPGRSRHPSLSDPNQP